MERTPERPLAKSSRKALLIWVDRHVMRSPKDFEDVADFVGSYELWTKLLQGGYIGDHIGDYYRGNEGGCLEFRL